MSFEYLKYATQFRLGEDSAPIYIIRAHTPARPHTRDAWNVTDGHAKNFLSKGKVVLQIRIHILMDYWDSLPDEDKEQINEQLKECEL